MSEFVGMEKLSLVDFDSKIVCTLFSSGCNFNCAFCHNSPLIKEVKDNYLKFEEIIAYLKSRKNMLDGVCITGGEPTLMDDLKEKIIQIKELGLLVKLDTNGTNPRILKELIEEKLIDYVAMDVKSAPEVYEGCCGTSVDMSSISESVMFLKEGRVPYEFRTTVVSELHSADHIRRMGEFLQGADKLFLQNYVDSPEVLTKNLHPLPLATLEEYKNILKCYIPNTFIRGI